MERILDLAKRRGILRARDVAAKGLPRQYLVRLTARGLLERTARGLYRLPTSEVSENHSLAEACARVPRGAICLLSALRFHNLTTQAPREIHMAIPEKDRTPTIAARRMRFFRFSGDAFGHGIETHQIDGVPVRVYSPAKTVADCFKFRSKVGQNVAIEALRDCIQGRKATVKELWAAAKVCRVTSIMRPYMEAML